MVVNIYYSYPMQRADLVALLRKKNRWTFTTIFGNEWAMEQALQRLAKEKDVAYEVRDRRILMVRLLRKDERLRDHIVDLIRVSHGYVEDEPLH